MFDNMTEKEAREQILRMVSSYYAEFCSENNEYMPGDKIPYAARVYDHNEMVSLVDSALDFWLTEGRYAKTFEEEFANFLGIKYCSLVNSGSSANLIAFMALTSPLLGDRAIKRGDEVITVAAGFPTTVAPIVQFGAVPVFVDVTIPQYNIDVDMLSEALSEKTKAIMVAHTLGNPFDIGKVKDFCEKHNLWLIEDNCDALGSKYYINGVEKYTGTIGDIGTSSFYASHQMTMGEGGAVYTDNSLLYKLILSFRDWGRDCICPPGRDNVCKHRFDRQYGELPLGYDHKYVFSHFGYNMKVTDMQAAIGVEQLKKLPAFIESRKNNFKYLKDGLYSVSDKIILPESCADSEPCWFGFPMTCKEGVNRNSIVKYLEDRGIQTRMLFAGNLIKHPCFDEMKSKRMGYRVVGDLDNTNFIMMNSFWVGVYPGMNNKKLDYIIKTIKEAFQ